MDENQRDSQQLNSKRVKERRHYSDDGFQEEEIEGFRMFSVEEKVLTNQFGHQFVKEMKGEDFTLKYIQENGFEMPVLFKDKSGLGMRIPNSNFTVNDVRQYVGNKRLLDVMDVTTQKDVEMSMKDWCRYYESPVKDKLYNVISLEFSHTKLENHVESPTVVRQMDWVDLVWPRNLIESHTESTNSIDNMKYPKVKKYCLMSVKGCFTDFHIDFGGSSVWYHILKGKKIFWLIPPTDENLQLYEQWVLSGKQSDVFLGDKVKECSRIELNMGDTFFIPTGWIHAVYTPMDSLVFGGNFLHSFGVEKQIRVSEIEDTTHVPIKFRYPFFSEIMWYTLQRYVHCILGKNYLIVPEEETIKEEPPVLEMSQLSVSPTADKPSLKPPKRVHLTKFELAGLKAIVNWLLRLPTNKKSVPEFLSNPEGLLNDVKVLLQDHARDDPLLAISGKPILFWPASSKSKSSTAAKTPKDKKNSANNARRRRTRCKKCLACLRADCGDCHFCKDMKKFGGPGKMKQSCISRQCMAPVLPHTACCMICGRDGWEKVSNPQEHENSSLMECSQCWEIVHPACLKERFPDLPKEGTSNEELPNSWECPKCCRDGKSDQIKPRNLKTSKPKELEALTAGTAEPLAMDQHHSFGPTVAAPTYFPPPQESSMLSPNSDQPLSLTISDRPLNMTKSAIQSGTTTFPPSALSTLPAHQKYPSLLHSTPKTKKFSKSPADSRPKSNLYGIPPRKHPETARDRLVKSMKGLKKNSEQVRMNHINRWKSNRQPQQQQPQNQQEILALNQSPTLRDSLLGNLPKPPENGAPESLLKPKIEPPSSPEETVVKTPPSLPFPPPSENLVTPIKEEEMENKRNDPPTPENMMDVKPQEDVILIKPKYVVRPAPLIEEFTPEQSDNLALRRDVMFPVFQYLNTEDLFTCMFVCKAWNRMSIDPRLWTKMNLTRRKITAMILMGIVRRQPMSLNLSWTNISKRQLSWLIARLPQLKELSLSGCSSIAASSLYTFSCPLLRMLDLSWIDCLSDALIRDLLSAPIDTRPGFIDTKTRLRHLIEIKLAGADISDMSLRVLTHNLPQLSKIDLSHCHKITDMGIAVLGAARGSRLLSLDVSYCTNITDTSLDALKRCSTLNYLNMQKCAQVSDAACQKFATQTRMTLKTPKQFEKAS